MGDGFTAAAGYQQFPNGNWSPTIHSKNVLTYFRTASVIEETTNTDYEGEIKGQGDVVKIMKEPVVTVRSYTRGQRLDRQDLADEDLELHIDQANYYCFQLDDIEKQMSHIEWANKAVTSGAFELKKAFDTNVLAYMVANGTSDVTSIGIPASPKTIGYGSGNDFTPLDYLNKLATIMDENDVPDDQRYVIANPAFWEQVGREDSSLIDVSVTGDQLSVIRNRKLATNRMIHGFMCFKSNNLGLDSSSNKVVIAGHKSAVATATTLTDAKSQDLVETFGQQYKALHVFGRKALRPEALFIGSMTIGDVDA